MNNVLVKASYLFIVSVAIVLVSCKNKDDVDRTKAFVKYYGGINTDNAVDVQQTSDGGYVIAGTSATTTTNSHDMIIVKTDAEGNETWHKTFGGPNYDRCGSLAIMPDGGYLLIGTYGVSV